MRSYIGLTVTALLLCPAVLAQDQAMRDEAADAAARASLETLASLVSQANYSQMGFDSPGEASETSLGEPLMEYMIRLDALQEYQPGADPEKLLVSTLQLIYPVEAAGRVRSAVTLTKASGEWRAVAFGKPTLAGLLNEYRKPSETPEPTDGDQAFAVRIPALNIYFLGSREGSQLLFTPLFDNKRLGLEKGRALPAAQVLEQLAPIARTVEDLPT